jgi:hypothetical protein
MAFLQDFIYTGYFVPSPLRWMSCRILLRRCYITTVYARVQQATGSNSEHTVTAKERN